MKALKTMSAMESLPLWPSILPEFEKQPVSCDVWTEEEKPQLSPGQQFSSLFYVDKEGFFIHIKYNYKETDVLEICQISDVRPGVLKDSKCLSYMNTHYSDLYGSDWQKQAFTVFSGPDLVDITYHHFVCSNAHEAEVWRESILRIARNKTMNNLSTLTYLRKHWTRLQLSRDETNMIPLKNISKSFSSGKGERDVLKVLQELIGLENLTNGVKSTALTFDLFYEFYMKMCQRDEVEELFRKIINDPSLNTINAEKFTMFLNDYQRDRRLNEILFPKKKPEAAKELIQKFELDKTAKEKNEMTLDGFIRFLMSDANSPINLSHLEVYMDMDQPLAHYFINSSHNTYLTGRQIYSKSVVEMYRQVLLSGCRCVELDCWDGEDGEPIITHGKAFCTCIDFKDVLYAIRDTAFVTSQYPVILSFENHCCKKQQKKMAQYCEEIFQDLLLKEPLPDHPLEPGRPLPSPNALKGKILLKNKRLDSENENQKEEAEKEDQKEEAESPEVAEDEPKSPKEVIHEGETNKEDQKEETEVVKDEPKSPKEVVREGEINKEDKKGETDSPDVTEDEPKSPVAQEGFSFDSSRLDDSQQEDQENETNPAEWKEPRCTKEDLEVNPRRKNEAEVVEVPHVPHKSSTTNIAPYLSKMVNYAQPIKFVSFAEAQRRNIHHNMSSFSETTGLSMLNSRPLEFVNYNKRQMSRIYPRAARLDSGNFMPQSFWSAGCQMVALNFQTPDVAMQLNQGKFEYNGNSGYLLKPEPLRSPHRDFNLFANSPIDGVVAAELKVEVLSGQFLSDKRIGTYVEVDMYGLHSDTIRKEFRTKIVPSNGLNPRYESEPFFFRKVVFPEFAALRFGVYDETGRLLGQRVIPFESLHSGYRHIPLRTEGNFPMTLPTLFCNIKINVYVPAHHLGFLKSLNYMNSKTNVNAIGNSKEEVKVGEELQASRNDSNQDFHRRAEFVQTKSFSSSEQECDMTDISGVPNSSKVPEKSGKGGSTFKKGSKSRMLDDKSFKFPAITIDMLKQDSDQFMKLIHKQEKKLRHLKIKHTKQCEALSRTQCLATEKLHSTKRKIKPKSEVGVPDIMAKQVNTWSELRETQREEELKMRENHLTAQFDKLERLMKAAQAKQIKELEETHKRNTKENNSKQAKSSIREIEIVRSDTALKSNGEKERCVREKKEQMTKVFAEERRMIIRRQENEMIYLRDQHKEQLKDIEIERKLAMEKIDTEKKEHKIDKIREFCA